MVYHFKIKSLISIKAYWIILIFAILLLSIFTNGVEGGLMVADEFGGLWVILALVIVAFAESVIKLAGHRLEITNGFFIFKTLFNTTWAIPVASIQRIDSQVIYQKNKGTFFSFTTDGKEYVCNYEPKNYSALIADLVAFNPKIILQNQPIGAIGILNVPSDIPLNKFFESKLKPNSLISSTVVKITSLSGIAIFFIFFILAIFFIFGVIAFDNYMNSN